MESILLRVNFVLVLVTLGSVESRWLQHKKSIRLSVPSEFVNDPYDSTTPTVILRKFLNELCEQPIFASLPTDWIQSAVYHWVNKDNAAREKYRISCWNIFDEHTSHLMWHQFAGGRTGVAILCPFEPIQYALEQTVTHEVFGEVELSGEGLVSYDTSSIVEQPFFKRPEYTDEREVRFVAFAHEEQDIEIPLHMLIDNMQMMLPPDAPIHHAKLIESG